jgi:predicted TPR repeat methyltransferase
MFAITSRRFPGTSLIFADILEWETEKRFDIVFAFASFVHLDKQDAQEVFKKVHTWLNSDGIFTFSLKHGEYREEFIEDENGPRVFYRYNKELLIKLLGSDFKILFCNVISLKNNAWIDIICQKN